MWSTLKGKATETLEALRPVFPSVSSLTLPSLPSLPSFPSLLPSFSSLSFRSLRSLPKVKEALEGGPTPESDSAVVRVIQQIFYYIQYIIEVSFFPFLSLIMASLIANEMIVYPAPIRFAFFLFTFLMCLSADFIVIMISLFYLLKYGFHYYVNEMSGGPKRIIMPTLFAMLPLTTKTYENRFINWLATPFQYGETWSEHDADELKERMELYDTALKESFPYVEALKSQDPFEGQLEKIVKAFEELHKAPPLPHSNNTLPATIQANPENAARFSATSSGPLPPVIQPPKAEAQ